MSMTESIKGWYLSGSTPELYDISIDTNVFQIGTKAGLLAAKSETNVQQFGPRMQGCEPLHLNQRF
ncbi:hypothetical protein RRU94_02915 [Domibacillus sp. DTU_2020_1001157_1_SI_ALB_TIR_016]|uniref:hypothetical protein n=1 Tax=Domibacillus sp. DTU_2020_1001157_1_SI_ALB_TIR_016 TaxID=3077789 RepID=UPI0028E57AF5|nr:hypothetical protein [Domibacillus sp. DTU_2020_1001157_1_SI_ALB_TIR_016]WNS78914.1 hypothetical protein RRU94_02915 [Domibacillus sp. DTU_2020_1001157_1_SI_ALB_TIR_016]